VFESVRNKLKVYGMGLISLLLFPVPTFIYRHFWLKESFFQFLQVDKFFSVATLNGLAIGVGFAVLAMSLFSLPFFKDELKEQNELVAQLQLNYFDALFLSVCAGIGEELLFRAGIQIWLRPILTSILFIAIHGYFNPKKWKTAIYGLLLFPFILLLSYGYEKYGLWFSASAHFAYDWVIFNSTIQLINSPKNNKL